MRPKNLLLIRFSIEAAAHAAASRGERCLKVLHVLCGRHRAEAKKRLLRCELGWTQCVRRPRPAKQLQQSDRPKAARSKIRKGGGGVLQKNRGRKCVFVCGRLWAPPCPMAAKGIRLRLFSGKKIPRGCSIGEHRNICTL